MQAADEVSRKAKPEERVKLKQTTSAKKRAKKLAKRFLDDQAE